MSGPGFIGGLPWFKDGLPVFEDGKGCDSVSGGCQPIQGNGGQYWLQSIIYREFLQLKDDPDDINDVEVVRIMTLSYSFFTDVNDFPFSAGSINSIRITETRVGGSFFSMHPDVATHYLPRTTNRRFSNLTMEGTPHPAVLPKFIEITGFDPLETVVTISPVGQIASIGWDDNIPGAAFRNYYIDNDHYRQNTNPHFQEREFRIQGAVAINGITSQQAGSINIGMVDQPRFLTATFEPIGALSGRIAILFGKATSGIRSFQGPITGGGQWEFACDSRTLTRDYFIPNVTATVSGIRKHHDFNPNDQPADHPNAKLDRLADSVISNVNSSYTLRPISYHTSSSGFQFQGAGVDGGILVARCTLSGSLKLAPDRLSWLPIIQGLGVVFFSQWRADRFGWSVRYDSGGFQEPFDEIPVPDSAWNEVSPGQFAITDWEFIFSLFSNPSSFDSTPIIGEYDSQIPGGFGSGPMTRSFEKFFNPTRTEIYSRVTFS